MKRYQSIAALAFMTVAGVSPLAAQAKISGLVQVWQTQAMDNNLRWNSEYARKYYNLRSEFKENTTSIRRSEIKFSGKITDDTEYEVMIDPSIATSASNPSIIQDVNLTFKNLFGYGLDVRVGQMKNYQSIEGLTSSSELLLAERHMIGRVFGDKRDRGLAFIKTFKIDESPIDGRVVVGVFNGLGDALSGKGNDTNAQKDFVARLEVNYGKYTKMGLYTLSGVTDLKDTLLSTTQAASFGTATGAPTGANIYDNMDETTNMGLFYQFQDATYFAQFEYMSGKLGRRFPSYGKAAGAASREHLEQEFVGYALTGAYTMDNLTFVVRYDVMDYNSGTKFYGTVNPYTLSTATGAPEYKEATVGLLYAFQPEKIKAANIKLNYIKRSSNFLLPRSGQTGVQGGDTLVLAFQMAF